MEKAVFVDRDGVINEMVYFEDHGFVDSPFRLSQFKMIKGVPKAISLFKSMGFRVIVISNQPGVAKKHYSKKTFSLIQKKMTKILNDNNTFIDDEFYCLHHPQAKLHQYKIICSCRKPKTGMIRQAISKHNIDPKNSYVIGDGVVDMEMAKKSNCKSIFVGNLNSTVLKLFKAKNLSPDYVVKDLLDAANLIKKLES